MRVFMDAYNFWVPLVLCLAILGCGFMLGCIWKGERAGS